jgi:serine/threonine-protein kinase
MDVSRSATAEAAFSDLAHRLGRVQARSIPRVLDAGVIDGVPYLAFEDTRGSLLTSFLHERSLSSLEVLRLASDVLDGLDAAHREGLTHGDLTPQNIVVARDRRGRFSARLIGLGAFRLLRESKDASATAAHTGSGTHAVSYMAPELFGGGVPSPATDLYAVGALLHHMVTGSPPAMAGSRSGFEDIPELPDVIGRAMARQPAQRYADAGSMQRALEWLDIESAKRNPATQDIAPWMETSHIGSVPVPLVSSTLPPAHASSSHPTGTVLSTSGPRPIPVAPVVFDDVAVGARRRLRIALLLLFLGTVALAGYRYRTEIWPDWSSALGSETEAPDVE